MSFEKKQNNLKKRLDKSSPLNYNRNQKQKTGDKKMTTKKEATKKETIEMRMKKTLQGFATKDAVDYYDNLIRSIDDLKDEAKRSKVRFLENMAEGKVRDAVSNLESSTHRQMQFNSYVDQAMRATARLISTFDIEIW